MAVRHGGATGSARIASRFQIKHFQKEGGSVLTSKNVKALPGARKAKRHSFIPPQLATTTTTRGETTTTTAAADRRLYPSVCRDRRKTIAARIPKTALFGSLKITAK